MLDLQSIIKYAIQSHAKCNHMYCDNLPYTFHLKLAAEFAEQFKILIPEEDWNNVLGGVWCHDLIEDTRETYNDVKKNTNEIIAEYSYALANEKGKNRKQRANEKYYNGIARYDHATFIKLCDRLANVSYSKENNPQIFKMYQDEQEFFQGNLYDGRFKEMWAKLESLLNK